ncbi:sigma-70 family RNA polymerase sigma factor [Puniceicoccales bacterium CK1056]|uniref:Sigma-70 family RNA polymerase sigma factor n=1 Tax=Oceanipulchritudo coccoides TaxID=2706888 RepID=A0A6B2M0P1_9BACT|nr:sigma-70 family RNA polymerase sigma factor [Oceanipulchritudo coccoides]NDV61345.1 sigma-70 family RNA polymerase sigma factor [Oceanipulchritudo coccoides]
MSLSKSVDGSLPVEADSAPESAANADQLLVSRVQEGDVAAFDVLVRKYRERLYGIIYNLTSNREDAADLTQEAFIKAFSSINRFKGKSAFFTWLYRIGVNTALSHLKRNRFRRFFSLETIQEEGSHAQVLETLAAKHKSEKGALLSELQEKLNEAMQKLSPKHRTVVVLFEIEGLSHQEIADVVGCSVGTVRSRLHYAKQQLQADLKHFLD